MLQDLRSFRAGIAPFRSLWSKLRIASAIVRRDERWVSISTRIALSHEGRGKPFFLRPTKDFIAFAKDLPISKLESLLDRMLRKGTMEARVGGKTLTVFLKAPDPNNVQQPGQQIHCGPPYSTRHYERDGDFEMGECHVRMTNLSLDNLYKIFNGDQRINVSSRLRTQRPRFSDVAHLFSQINLASDSNQTYTTLEIVAPLPFSMHTTGTTVTVTSPSAITHKLRVTGFFDTGDAIVKLKPLPRSNRGLDASMSGSIPWPAKSTRGKLFLYFGKDEIGCVQIRRWAGSTNWQLSAHDFFDKNHTLLKAGLLARKESEQFETAVVRLLNELQVPAVWYGTKQYQDRTDLMACVQGKQDWWVLMGECTGQKPSDKFTRLLTRQNELMQLLQGEVRIVPVVFTPSTVSTPDKQQAREDGIILVGADELAILLRGVNLAWDAAKVLGYLEGLSYAPLESIFQQH